MPSEPDRYETFMLQMAEHQWALLKAVEPCPASRSSALTHIADARFTHSASTPNRGESR